IFDAGRLTDTQGRTTDFRRTIIILTSNLGSSAAREAPVGFRAVPPPPTDRDAVLRELGRWFRPEFLNRLDQVVMFRPLAAETRRKNGRARGRARPGTQRPGPAPPPGRCRPRRPRLVTPGGLLAHLRRPAAQAHRRTARLAPGGAGHCRWRGALRFDAPFG